MNHFFIFGLPRSMTAWMANFLTSDQSFCFHELWADVETKEEFFATLETMTLPFTGNSDPSNIVMFEEIHARYPQANMVYLERDTEFVNRSIAALGMGLQGDLPTEVIALASQVRDFVRSTGGLVIDVNDWSIEKARAVWNHCLPKTPFNLQRTRQLLNLNVQVTKDRIRSYDRLGSVVRNRVKELWH